MVSTASDYGRFAQMLLSGGELDHVRLLSPRSVAFMTSDHLWPGIAFSPVTVELFEPLGIAPTPKVGQGFGLGFVVRTQEGRNPMPGSPGEYYWAGIWGTAFWADPKREADSRIDDASSAATGPLLPFLDPQSHVSGTHRLTAANPERVISIFSIALPKRSGAGCGF
jgi:hypothetical protein